MTEYKCAISHILTADVFNEAGVPSFPVKMDPESIPFVAVGVREDDPLKKLFTGKLKEFKDRQVSTADVWRSRLNPVFKDDIALTIRQSFDALVTCTVVPQLDGRAASRIPLMSPPPPRDKDVTTTTRARHRSMLRQSSGSTLRSTPEENLSGGSPPGGMDREQNPSHQQCVDESIQIPNQNVAALAAAAGAEAANKSFRMRPPKTSNPFIEGEEENSPRGGGTAYLGEKMVVRSLVSDGGRKSNSMMTHDRNLEDDLILQNGDGEEPLSDQPHETLDCPRDASSTKRKKKRKEQQRTIKEPGALPSIPGVPESVLRDMMSGQWRKNGKCGHCQHCLNPVAKRGCLTQRALRAVGLLASGSSFPSNKKKRSCEGEEEEDAGERAKGKRGIVHRTLEYTSAKRRDKEKRKFDLLTGKKKVARRKEGHPLLKTNEKSDVEVDGWTHEQRVALELAVANIPPTMPNKWQAIAKRVPGKSSSECFARVFSKELAKSTKKADGERKKGGSSGSKKLPERMDTGFVAKMVHRKRMRNDNESPDFESEFSWSD